MEDLLARRIQYFQEMMGCIPGMEFWEFSPELALTGASSQEPRELLSLFSVSGCMDLLKEYINTGETNPLVLTDTFGISWIAAFEYASGHLCRIYSVGPVFTSPISGLKIRADLRARGYSTDIAEQFSRNLESLPVFQLSSWLNIGAMLNLTVTGVKPEVSDFRYRSKEPENPNNGKEKGTELRRMPVNSTWTAEQAAMKAIEDGDLNYKKAFSDLSSYDIYSESYQSDSRRQFRKLHDSLISFIALCTRAAIRGGLSPETAYYIGEMYNDQIDVCHTASELMQVNNAMFEDFVHRVHEVKAKNLSLCIQTCCAYIQKHINEKINISDMASETGYVEYYLTKKFRKEMGMSVSEYVKNKRIEMARQLLTTTEKPVQDIATELGFNNTSYFTKVFRDATGKSPREYRG